VIATLIEGSGHSEANQPVDPEMRGQILGMDIRQN